MLKDAFKAFTALLAVAFLNAVVFGLLGFVDGILGPDGIIDDPGFMSFQYTIVIGTAFVVVVLMPVFFVLRWFGKVNRNVVVGLGIAASSGLGAVLLFGMGADWAIFGVALLAVLGGLYGLLAWRIYTGGWAPAPNLTSPVDPRSGGSI